MVGGTEMGAQWGGTYGSAIRGQAESDGGGAAQVGANKCSGWRRGQGKLHKAFPVAAHICPYTPKLHPPSCRSLHLFTPLV